MFQSLKNRKFATSTIFTYVNVMIIYVSLFQIILEESLMSSNNAMNTNMITIMSVSGNIGEGIKLKLTATR